MTLGASPSLVSLEHSALLDAHCRLGAEAPVVSLVVARTRLEARRAFTRWARDRGFPLVMAPMPTLASVQVALRGYADQKPVVLFAGRSVEMALEAAQPLAGRPKLPRVGVVASINEVLSTLTDPAVPKDRLNQLVRGLTPVDPIEQAILRHTVKLRRLQPFLRSEYEGLLYFLLESHSPTRGRMKTNQRLEGQDGDRYEVDLVFENPRLIVEVDGAQHKTPKQSARDAAKEAALRPLGYDFYRVSTVSLVTAPLAVREEIERALARAATKTGQHAP